MSPLLPDFKGTFTNARYAPCSPVRICRDMLASSGSGDAEEFRELCRVLLAGCGLNATGNVNAPGAHRKQRFCQIAGIQASGSDDLQAGSLPAPLAVPGGASGASIVGGKDVVGSFPVKWDPGASALLTDAGVNQYAIGDSGASDSVEPGGDGGT